MKGIHVQKLMTRVIVLVENFSHNMQTVTLQHVNDGLEEPANRIANLFAIFFFR